MTQRLAKCCDLLAQLIALRTHNPGGDEVAICRFLADALKNRGCDSVKIVEVPRQRGGVRATGAYVFSSWGVPRTLINIHVDTVPANNGWQADPFTPSIEEDRVVGLGSTDIKGAIAALLVALENTRPNGLGVLFSGDEEAGGSCLLEFLGSDDARPVERAVVCEPTLGMVGIRHRGMRAYRATIAGEGGHSSAADHRPKPIAAMARLGVALDELGRRHLELGPEDMKGLCMNVARLDGGVAFNVIPDHASLSWSLRPPPGCDVAALESEIELCVRRADDAIRFTNVMSHPPFASRDSESLKELLGPMVTGYGPLQFWTEAASLSDAGIDAVVVGPGDIRQAHAADEFILKRDLDWGMDFFDHVLAFLRSDHADK